MATQNNDPLEKEKKDLPKQLKIFLNRSLSKTILLNPF